MKLSSFSTYWAFYVYSYLSRFGMPYFWPIFFHNYSYSNFDVFWNMKLSSFSTQSGISCLLIFEWIRNALLFFGPSFFNTYTCLNFDVFRNMILSSFSTQSGISCLLIFEWMQNALLFFWPVIFSHLLLFKLRC